MRRVFAPFLIVAVATFAAAADQPLPHVVVTNDDGIEAPGIDALVQALKGDFRVTVCAPAEEQSAVGHGITYRTPVLVEERGGDDGVRRFAIHAQPATCIRLCLSALLVSDPPALVLSGINRGDNSGRSTWVSGTVAGAREAALMDHSAVCFSAQTPPGREPDYGAAASWARGALDRLRAASLPRAGELVKVDIPHPAGLARGIAVVGVGLAKAEEERFEERPGAHGERLFVSRYKAPATDQPGTDVEALASGFVTVTPLTLDQTDYLRIPELSVLFWSTSERGEK